MTMNLLVCLTEKKRKWQKEGGEWKVKYCTQQLKLLYVFLYRNGPTLINASSVVNPPCPRVQWLLIKCAWPTCEFQCPVGYGLVTFRYPVTPENISAALTNGNERKTLIFFDRVSGTSANIYVTFQSQRSSWFVTLPHRNPCSWQPRI